MCSWFGICICCRYVCIVVVVFDLLGGSGIWKRVLNVLVKILMVFFILVWFILLNIVGNVFKYFIWVDWEIFEFCICNRILLVFCVIFLMVWRRIGCEVIVRVKVWVRFFFVFWKDFCIVIFIFWYFCGIFLFVK